MLRTSWRVFVIVGLLISALGISVQPVQAIRVMSFDNDAAAVGDVCRDGAIVSAFNHASKNGLNTGDGHVVRFQGNFQNGGSLGPLEEVTMVFHPDPGGELYYGNHVFGHGRLTWNNTLAPGERIIIRATLVHYATTLEELFTVNDCFLNTAGQTGPAQAGFMYQGTLVNEEKPVNGAHDFRFSLFDNLTDGNRVGDPIERLGVSVTDGLFSTPLPFSASAFQGGSRWLEIEVRPAGGGNYTKLAPRQSLLAAPLALYALTIPLHNHLGQTWNGNEPLFINGTFHSAFEPIRSYPLVLANDHPAGRGLYVGAAGDRALFTQNLGTGVALWAENQNEFATVYADNQGAGVALQGQSLGNVATVYALNQGAGNALVVRNTSTDYPTLYAENHGANTAVDGKGNGGPGGRFTTNGGVNILIAQEQISANSYDLRFRVAHDGQVYADGPYSSRGADFAELLPAVAGVAPGDVLVIGPDGRLTLSTTPNAATVAGVYSTAPAFLGGYTSPEVASVNPAAAPADSQGPSGSAGAASALTAASSEAEAAANAGKIPLAVVGVVPVKVTAENGPIQPGDLLTSASLPGHAMKATPIEVGGVQLYRPGTIIGKALTAHTSGAGVITMLIQLQ